jgi:hypothetical protein
MLMSFPRRFLLAASVAMLALPGCSGGETEYSYPNASRAGKSNDLYGNNKTIFGDGGFSLFGGDKKDKQEGGGSGIAVNSFLWRASLDTVSYLPLASADPFGGVIITDWYTAPESPNERVKMQIYILDRQLRSDGLRVSIFREAMQEGHWVAASVSDRTVRTVEDSILTRARELRIQANGSAG